MRRALAVTIALLATSCSGEETAVTTIVPTTRAASTTSNPVETTVVTTDTASTPPETAVPAPTPTTTTTSTTTATTTPTTAADPSASAPPATTAEASTTTTLDPTRPFVVHWIGGSDVVLEDRDLPRAVGARIGTIGARPVEFVADTMIGPLVVDIRERVRTAADAGADAMIIALNPSWIHWDGAACDGMTPPETRYACLMTPVSPDVTAGNAAALSDLVDAVAATGLPAYLYTIPHSSNSLADPVLADLIGAAESEIAAFDPGLERVEFVGIFNRGLAGMAVGEGFINIVHPNVVGVERLADWLAVDLERFWTEVAS